MLGVYQQAIVTLQTEVEMLKRANLELISNQTKWNQHLDDKSTKAVTTANKATTGASIAIIAVGLFGAIQLFASIVRNAPTAPAPAITKSK